jgi:phosphoglycolate phosphatase
MTLTTEKFNAIIFDLDGTLINTVPDVRLALNHTLATFGATTIAAGEIYELIGKGATHMLNKAFALKNKKMTANEIEMALTCYLDFYMANPVAATEIYPDVVVTLTDLKNAGFNLGVCTNKPGVITRLVLDKLNLSDLFSAVICGNEIAQSKPHAQHVFDTITKMNAASERAVFVGDSEVDRLSAANANLPFIGVSYGYDLDKTAAGVLINHFNELPNAITHLATRK